jgi:glycosyltransferase involved in cell wall biosynthesis
MKDILCINYHIDMGNITLERNLKYLLSDNMDFFSFNKKNDSNIKSHFKNRSLSHKILSAITLRKTLKEYSNNKTIIFNSIGPATWGYGAYKCENSILMLDWTRSFSDFVNKKRIKRDNIHILQSYILKRIPKILCRNNKIIENLANCYGVKYSQMKRIPGPLNAELFNINPRKTPTRPKVLFIGNDFERKGGSLLIDNLDLILQKFDITIVTKDNRANVKGVNFINDVKYGSQDHKKILYDHDIFIFPSKHDPYGMVLAEAASAGLAIITTKFAFSSEELIKNENSGIIVNEPKECISALMHLAENPSLIDKFKSNIHRETHINFSKTRLQKLYMEIINN